MSLQVNHLYRFGPFDLDTEQRLVRRSSTRIPLPPKAFELLLYMVQNPLRPLSKEELMQAVWPDCFVAEGNLSQNIFLLRKALTMEQDEVRYVVTVPGRGYQFSAPVEVVSSPPRHGGMAEENSELKLTSVRSRVHIVLHEQSDDETQNRINLTPGIGATRLSATRRRWRILVAAVVLLSAAGGGFYYWTMGRPKPSGQTIVLADFQNRTGDQAFDHALKKALEIDLRQSPYLDLMSDKQVGATLQLMGRETDAAIPPDVAAEICQRSNSQAAIEGSIANLGRDYLVTLQASDCISGKQLAESKAEAAGKENVLHAVDVAAEKLRKDLGESKQSVEQFQVPIAQATTPSLAALQAYSIGEYMVGRQGKEETETLPLFQRAVELDPQFAMAYGAIASDYYNLSEPRLAAPYYQKAFDLSGRVSEKERLDIRAHYYADSLKDVERGIREYKLWTLTYPRDWMPWLNIANEYTQLGQYAPAVAAGEQALRMEPGRGITYSVLARAYVRTNRFAEARALGERAIALGRDSYGLHATLLQIAFQQQDQEAITREINWAHGRPSEWFSLYIQACAAETAGMFKRGEEMFAAAHAAAERANLGELAGEIQIDQALMEFQLGQAGAARATLKHKGTLVEKQPQDNPDLIFVEAALGNLPAAEQFLANQANVSPADTLLHHVQIPRLLAEIAQERSQPLDALAALAATEDYELSEGFQLMEQRAEAYQQTGQLDRARQELEKILAHQGLDLVSPLYPLAHLRLARLDAEVGDLAASRTHYQSFFSCWKSADPDLPLLLAARKEYAAVSSRSHP